MEKVIMPKELTAENGAKALLIGEFEELIKDTCPKCLDLEDVEMCECCGGSGQILIRVQISWITIKEIYRMAVKHLSEPLKQPI